MEKLIIENFAGIEYAEIEIKPINIFIGPQSSGKSIISKLVYFFKSLLNDVLEELKDYTKNNFHNNYDLLKDETSYFKVILDKLNPKLLKKFHYFFPPITYNDIKTTFKIEYKYQSNIKIVIILKDRVVYITYDIESWINSISYIKTRQKVDKIQKGILGIVLLTAHLISKNNDFIDTLLDTYTENNQQDIKENLVYIYKELKNKNKTHYPLFIPASRNVFSFIPNSIFNSIKQNKEINIDPLILEFRTQYEKIKTKNYLSNASKIKIPQEYISSLLKGKYIKNNSQEYLCHKDYRTNPIAFTSSGQQEIIPLLNIINHILYEKDTMYNLFIEEPEAHLYPQAQKEITDLLAYTYNQNRSSYKNLFITTHSPYILAAFNNLIYAAELAKNPETKAAVNEIIDENLHLSFDDFNVFFVNNGKLESVLDEESRLISAEKLDEISNTIYNTFNQLVDLQA